MFAVKQMKKRIPNLRVDSIKNYDLQFRYVNIYTKKSTGVNLKVKEVGKMFHSPTST